MRKSAAALIIARRSGVSPGRVFGLNQKLSDAGLLTKAEGNRADPPDLPPHELQRMVLAVLADRGFGHVIESVREFGALTNEAGDTFDDALADVLAGTVDVTGGDVEVQLEPAAVSLVMDGTPQRFGAAPAEAAAKRNVVPGTVLAAIACELRGHSSASADFLAGLNRLSHQFTAAA